MSLLVREIWQFYKCQGKVRNFVMFVILYVWLRHHNCKMLDDGNWGWVHWNAVSVKKNLCTFVSKFHVEKKVIKNVWECVVINAWKVLLINIMDNDNLKEVYRYTYKYTVLSYTAFIREMSLDTHESPLNYHQHRVHIWLLIMINF